MSVRRLRWRSASRQQALADRLRQELNAWLEGWSVDPASLTLTVARARTTPTGGVRWLRASGKSGTALLGAHANALDGLGGLIAQSTREDTLGLGKRVGDRALRALLAQFASTPSNQLNLQESVAPSDEDLDPRFIGCELLIEGAGFEARLIVDSDLCEHWVPSKRQTLQPLSTRETALAPEHVRLNVILDLGQANLAETRGLRVGDVLVSATPIGTPFQIAHPDSRQLANAHLFRRGTQRALQIDSVTSLRKTP